MTARRGAGFWAAAPLRQWLAFAAGPPLFVLGALLVGLAADDPAPSLLGWVAAATGFALWIAALRRLSLLLGEALDLTDRVRAAIAEEFSPESLEEGLADPFLRSLAYATGRALRQRNEAVRAEADERLLLRAVLDGIPSGVLVVGLNRRVELASAQVEALLGIQRAEGRPYADILSHPRLAAAVERSLQGDAVEPFEFEHRAGDRTRTLLISVSPLPVGQGRARQAGAVVVLHDVTELRRLERSRRDLVANVSHELRTPVAAILGFAETLAAGEAEGEDARRFLQLMRREAERVARLVEDLLRLARLESPEFTVRRQPLDAGELARAVAERFAPEAARRGQRLELEVPDAPVRLDADPELLQQALANLVDNAVSYTQDGGWIRIEVVDRGDEVEIRVRDDGPGIAPEHQPRLFERFYRIDDARGRRRGGTGLGLAIVKHVALAHGGAVGVESRPGAGALFWIRLPRQPARRPLQ